VGGGLGVGEDVWTALLFSSMGLCPNTQTKHVLHTCAMHSDQCEGICTPGVLSGGGAGHMPGGAWGPLLTEALWQPFLVGCLPLRLHSCLGCGQQHCWGAAAV
jgi:hypothetical protein